MPPNAFKSLHQGREHHQAGRLEAALDCYHHVLELEPENPDALHLVGLVHHQRGAHAQALRWLQRAAERSPNCWLYESSLGCALHALGRVEEASAHHAKAVELAPDQPALRNNLASAYQDLGRLAEAEELYRQAIAASPDYADAHYNLANVLRQSQRSDLAVAEYERAIQINPQYRQAHVNLANMLLAEGRLEEATRRYRWALEIEPSDAETHSNLALALLMTGQFDEAERAAERALALQPAHPQAPALRDAARRRERPRTVDGRPRLAATASPGRITDSRWGLHDATLDEAYRHALDLHKRGQQFEIAEGIYREILRQQPAHADATYKLGVLLRQTGRSEQAIDVLARAITLDPQRPGSYFHQASALLELERKEEAIAPLKTTIGLRPDFGEAYLNLGAVLERLGRLDESLPECRRAVALLPESAQAHYNLANVLLHTGAVRECLAEYDLVVRLDPQFAKGHWNRGLTQLLLGDFEQGWEGYEWRETAGEVTLDRYDLPRWDGSPLAGRTILVHAEQGVGDEIMFNSCVPDLLDQGARVALTCDPRLKDLFARSFPGVTVLPLRRAQGQTLRPESGVDCHVPIGTLPFFLRRGWAKFPQRCSYLTADAAQIEAWRRRHAALGPGLKIGISWRAGGKASEQRRRTTALAHWAPLLQTPGVHFVNLQYGDSREDLEAARRELGVTIHDWPEADPLNDLDGFAAQIAALDLVISVGNTTVHTAGALGVPAWAALPAVPGWRWMLHGESIPWYTTVKLFRQTDPEDWQGVFARMADELRERIGGTRRAAAALPAPPGLFEQALALHQAGDLPHAEHLYEQLLSREPRHANALACYGALARQTGRAALAVERIEQAVALAPEAAAYRYNLGNALRDLRRFEEAASQYRAALELDPGFAQAHLNLGVTFRDLGKPDEALAACDAALRLEPRWPEALYNAGAIQAERGELEAAVGSFSKALAVRPDYADAHSHLAGALRALGRWEEALAHYDRTLELRPGDGEARTQRAMILLQQGRLQQGWAEYEWRWHSARPPRLRHREHPLWEGSPAPTETLLVYGEQGLGDEIMFASCLRDAAGLVQKVVLECDPRLQPVFERSFPQARVVARDAQTPTALRAIDEADYAAPLGSLPRVVRRSMSDFVPARPYLRAEPGAVAAWRDRLLELPRGPRIGLAWRGGRARHDGSERSVALPALVAAMPAGAQLISLQHGGAADEIAAAAGQSGRSLRTWPDFEPGSDVDRLAGLLANLDLVVAVGNATAHLSGALGCPTWTLLPFAPSWRWFAGRDDSPWYSQMRLWRQPARGDWQSVLDRLAAELRAWIASRAADTAIPGPHFVNARFRPWRVEPAT